VSRFWRKRDTSGGGLGVPHRRKESAAIAVISGRGSDGEPGSHSLGARCGEARHARARVAVAQRNQAAERAERSIAERLSLLPVLVGLFVGVLYTVGAVLTTGQLRRANLVV
jgi:hypothetical protein